jgi:serine/threonine protein kinase
VKGLDAIYNSILYSYFQLLQPQNLLLTGPYPDCDIKLCDFGISRVIQSGVEVREILGTPDYVGMLYDQ